MTPLFSDLSALLECAVDLVDPAVDRSFLSAGEVALDECECGGMLWIRPISVWPSSTFPNQLRDFRKCSVPTATRFGLGIARCITGADALSTGVSLAPADMTADAEQAFCDMANLYTALTCCEIESRPGIVVDTWTPIGPEGGCYGGEWTAYIDSELTCQPESS